MKDNGKMIKEMEKVSKFMKIKINMMETGLKIIKTAKVSLPLLMVINT